MRCRSKRSLVALESRQTLPALPRDHAWFAAYVTDVGRAGVGLLHGEPFYPKERMRIILPNGTPKLVEVVRCERFDGAATASGRGSFELISKVGWAECNESHQRRSAMIFEKWWDS